MTEIGQPLRIVVLSGPTCAGKSALAQQLIERYSAHVIKTHDLIRQHLPKVKDEPRALDRAGQKLDRQEKGAWVKEALARYIDDVPEASRSEGLFVVDAVASVAQVAAIREVYNSAVHHIHLTASDPELRKRFNRQRKASAASSTYIDIKQCGAERKIQALKNLADVVVATDRCKPEAVLVRATALLNLYPRSTAPLVDVLVGGQYGSEGKGNVVGYIAPEYDLLVRVGGPNAGHKVFAEPEPEAYYHIPSGTERAPRAQLLLGAGALIYTPRLLEEIAKHQITRERLSIDPQAMIIEEDDRTTEQDALKSISSTAQGVGWASARKIMGRGSGSPTKVRLAKDVPALRPYIREAQEILEDAFVHGKKVLLEGTQGTALSLHHGKYPYVTSRDTTVSGCLADAGIAPKSVRRIVMVCRTYPIRVGGPSGPMDRKVSYEELARRSGIPRQELKKTEITTTTRRQRRIAEFDWKQYRRSVLLNGPTDIALTFVDYLDVDNRNAYRFEQLTEDTLRFIEELERVSGRPVSLISTNFHWRNVIDRRSW